MANKPTRLQLVANESEYISQTVARHSPPVELRESTPTRDDEIDIKKRIKLTDIISKSNDRLTHVKVPSRSVTNPFDLTDLGLNTVTGGGYGLFNAYDDDYDKLKYMAGDPTQQQLESDVFSSSVSNHEAHQIKPEPSPSASEHSATGSMVIHPQATHQEYAPVNHEDEPPEEDVYHDDQDDEDSHHHIAGQSTHQYTAMQTINNDIGNLSDVDVNEEYMAVQTTNIDDDSDDGSASEYFGDIHPDNEYMAVKTVTIDDDAVAGETHTDTKQTRSKPPRKDTKERLMIQIKLATDDHIRVHSNYELSHDESIYFHLLHWCGLLHFVHIIYINI
eukprot:163251_1